MKKEIIKSGEIKREFEVDRKKKQVTILTTIPEKIIKTVMSFKEVKTQIKGNKEVIERNNKQIENIKGETGIVQKFLKEYEDLRI